MRRLDVIVVIAALVTGGGSAFAGDIKNSAHNLSASGPGSVRAASESRVCEFCHTPHSASAVAALWNRRNPGATYTPYSSSTALAAPGQPTGASLLCLSCHDGTIALGEVLNRRSPIAMAKGANRMPPGRARTGTDLRHHHPISFVFDANLARRRGELRMPSSLPQKIRLDQSGQMQCTSCHDPHDDEFGSFLVMPNANSSLCVQCHEKEGWDNNPHARSPGRWNGEGANPWPNSEEGTVAGNACHNCHETHQTGGGSILLRHASEEETCEACHNGNVAAKNVMSDIDQISAHPIRSMSQSHDPAEAAVVEDRHVECADCHNLHSEPVNDPGANGPPAGVGRRPAPRVRGVDLNSTGVQRASRGYEVCMRCHGDSPGKRSPQVRRQLDQNNVRMEFQPGNPSFHPIVGPGRNPDVPSLIDPLTPQTVMDCIDCHNSSSAASVGGSGPEGPHGSSFEPILVRNYETTDFTVESPAAYALCYSCHSRDSILNDESFAEHDKHIRGEDTPCSVCHDAHGVSAVQGNQMNNTNLINFDTTVVEPNSQGILRFDDQGRYSGSCDLMCHGKDHQSEAY